MQVIGFNITKVSAEKSPDFNKAQTVSTNLEFTDYNKETLTFLKDSEVVKLHFKYSFTYINPEKKKDPPAAEIIFEGFVTLSLSKDEIKESEKTWKKKELPNNIKIPVFNFILRKCTPKSISLEEEIGLPLRVPVPQIQPPEESK